METHPGGRLSPVSIFNIKRPPIQERCEFMVAKIKAIIQTGITVILLCGIWQMLEYITYREVQPRGVDDIMVLLFIPFIYGTCRYSK